MAKILGLDLGTKTLGVAITDDNQQFVFGVENFTFAAGNYKAAQQRVLALTSKEKITQVVIGYPLQLDDGIGTRAQSVDRFIDDVIALNPQLEFIRVDERLSTIEARERLISLGYTSKKIATIIDMWAARVILETYLARKEEHKHE